MFGVNMTEKINNKNLIKDSYNLKITDRCLEERLKLNKI